MDLIRCFHLAPAEVLVILMQMDGRIFMWEIISMSMKESSVLSMMPLLWAQTKLQKDTCYSMKKEKNSGMCMKNMDWIIAVLVWAEYLLIMIMMVTRILFVNHDFGYKRTPDMLLENQYPKEKFIDVAKERRMDLRINSMGTAVGDYNNDGLMDYYMTNIRFNYFMVNQGAGKPFVNKAKELGMDFFAISWGANFADFDHDGDVDLFVANGDLNPNCVPMADFYFENIGGKFQDHASAYGLADYGIGRGSVVFDYDNDGDLDLLVVNQEPVLNYPGAVIYKIIPQ